MEELQRANWKRLDLPRRSKLETTDEELQRLWTKDVPRRGWTLEKWMRLLPTCRQRAAGLLLRFLFSLIWGERKIKKF
uniref:Uncharacterized protein n=1 Tax=Manihot esculenta TaxID=3983 RepID=A0A2C9VJE7_MANES